MTPKNLSPKEIKQLNNALSKLYKEQRKNNPFKAVSNMLDEANERMSIFDEEIEETQKQIDKLSKKENRTEGKLGVFLLCLALFPLAVDCIRVISTLFHNLMLFSFTSVYVLTAVAFENCSPDLSKKGRGCVKDILAACMIVVAVINLYYANAVFMKLFMQFEQAHSFYTSIVTELRQDPDFNKI